MCVYAGVCLCWQDSVLCAAGKLRASPWLWNSPPPLPTHLIWAPRWHSPLLLITMHRACSSARRALSSQTQMVISVVEIGWGNAIFFSSFSVRLYFLQTRSVSFNIIQCLKQRFSKLLCVSAFHKRVLCSMVLCVCVYVCHRERKTWEDKVCLFKQNSVVASHLWPLNTKPFQMSLWRSSWMNQCLFTLLFFSLSLSCFLFHCSPYSGDRTEGKSRGLHFPCPRLHSSLSHCLLHDRLKDFSLTCYIFLSARYFSYFRVLMIPSLQLPCFKCFVRIIDEMVGFS